MQTANEDSYLFALLEKEPVSYLEELKIGEKEVPLSGYGLEGFLSNEKSGAVTAKAKEGWEITEVRYYPENNLNIKGGKNGNATTIIFNNVFPQGEKKSRKIGMDAPVEYGKCYTHFFIYLQNPENGKKSKEAVTVFAYDELIIDWGQMIDGQTQFVFNLDYLEGDDLKNDDIVNAIAEIANIVAGNACSLINKTNSLYGFRVAPPTVVYGESIKISKAELQTVTSVIAETSFGEVYMNVGFSRSEDHE